MPRAFDDYFLIDDAELEEMIKDLARQLGTSAISLSSPDAGNATYTNRSDMRRTMKSLRRSWAARNGVEYPEAKIRYHTLRAQNGYVD